jgi:hypothetical protein
VYLCFNYALFTVPGAYFHPKFVRSDRTLCRDIVRVKMVSTQLPKKNDRRIRTPRKSKKSRGGMTQRIPTCFHQRLCVAQRPHQVALPDATNNSMHRIAMIEPTASSTTNCYDDVCDVLPFAEFSDHLLSYSEDIIGIFGSPDDSNAQMGPGASKPRTAFL